MKEKKIPVKISRETWIKLQQMKATLQSQQGKSISFSDVILYLISNWSSGGRDHDRQ